jgi:hypothetical protein
VSRTEANAWTSKDEVTTMNDERLYEMVHELRRLNDAIAMLFGLPDVGSASTPLMREVQKLIDDDEVLRARGVWAAVDNTGQVHLCVRVGFMQPPTTFPINSAEEAEDYMRGMRRRL